MRKSLHARRCAGEQDRAVNTVLGFLFQHGAGRLLRHQERPVGGDHQRLAHVFGIKLDQRRAHPRRGVADAHPQRPTDLAEQLLHGSGVGDVARVHAGVRFRGERGQLGGVARGQRDPVTLAREQARKRCRQARTRPRYQSNRLAHSRPPSARRLIRHMHDEAPAHARCQPARPRTWNPAASQPACIAPPAPPISRRQGFAREDRHGRD